MGHPEDTNYIIEVISDGWSRPDSFGPDLDPDLRYGLYRIMDNGTSGTAASYGYTTAHSYPQALLDIAPNLPDCTASEAATLQKHFVSGVV